jgi:hypothetical protein
MRRGTGWRRWAAVVGFCAAMTASAAAEATVAVPLSQAEQVGPFGHGRARHGALPHVRVECRSVAHRHPHPAAGDGELQGPCRAGAELVLRQFGGETEGLVERVPGDPRLADGEDVVVFLRNGPGVAFLTAMAQSVYHLHPAAPTTGTAPATRTAATTVPTVTAGTVMARRDLDGITFARPRADGPDGDLRAHRRARGDARQPCARVCAPSRRSGGRDERSCSPRGLCGPVARPVPRPRGARVPAAGFAVSTRGAYRFRIGSTRATIPASLGEATGVAAIEAGMQTWAAPACSAWRTTNAGNTSLTRCPRRRP